MAEITRLAAIESDLAARVNPEKSRNFQSDRFERTLELLTRIVRQPAYQSSARRIAVVGTNAKGSVAWYLASLAKQVQNGVGLYTSPHLIHFLERIRIDNRPITAAALHPIYFSIADDPLITAADLTYFEMLTLSAIRAFAAESCWIEIYEAGLGGRLDATRIARPEVVVVTTISLDHTALLGETTEAILYEKLAIADRSTWQFVVMHQNDQIRRCIEQWINQNHPGKRLSFFRERTVEESYLDYARAFALFVLALTIEQFPKDQLTNLALNPPPGRLEQRHSPDGIDYLFDTAHNQEAHENLLLELTGHNQPVTRTLVVIGTLVDRNVDEMAGIYVNAGVPVVIFQAEGFSTTANPKAAVVTNLAGLKARINQMHPDRVVFAGSHRLYPLYIQSCIDPLAMDKT